MRLLPESAVTLPIRIAGATFAVAIAPGALTVLAWRPKNAFTLLELIGLGLGVGFGLIQICTVVAMVLHLSPALMLALLGLWALGHAYVAARRARGSFHLRVPNGEWLLLSMLAVLAGLFYAIGAPITSGEDQIHIAIIRRLAALQAPALDNIYYSPKIVYTYPFPATHYLMALIARTGDVDAMFLYHKLRAFWVVAAGMLLYGCARAVLRSGGTAVAATAVALALVANGAYAAVPSLYWGQLAPFSHASDIAMGVLLPALLLLSFHFLQAATRREQNFFFATALMMALSIIVVHPREIIQFLVYLGASCLALLAVGRQRTALRRTAVLLGATAVLLIVYLEWHKRAVPSIDPILIVEREQLRQLFQGMSWTDLFGSPIPLAKDYILYFSSFFRGWIPLVLLASPLMLLVLPESPLAWLMAGSITGYMLIVRLPIFAVPYLYASYFEMLYTPVRNVIFFAHLLTGIGVATLSVLLARLRLLTGLALAAAIAGALAFVYPQVQPLLERNFDLLFVPVVLGATVALAYVRWRRPAPFDFPEHLPGRTWLILALFMAPLLVRSAVPESAAVDGSLAESARTPDALRLPRDCARADGTFNSCTPPTTLTEFLRRKVPVESVLAIDKLNEYPVAALAPQQIVVWPSRSSGLLEEESLFSGYFAHYHRAMDRYDVQPLFNDRESRDARLAFVRDLGVTHVLIDPQFHTMMLAVLARDPDIFQPRYDDGQWALYEVSRSYR